uniref:Cohesin subunit putative n=1 Tax=Albugo laibachii Nc14 TaxID=890382 RepID=F0VZV4_9STRA|nr:cohesin subunit putative [Albugo laibachii Nc14]|eukprot:CCA14325.1 cohesin subunit putative [Albugo laibachii Nc14]
MRRSMRERRKPTPLYKVNEIQKEKTRMLERKLDHEDEYQSDALTSMTLVKCNRDDIDDSDILCLNLYSISEEESSETEEKAAKKPKKKVVQKESLQSTMIEIDMQNNAVLFHAFQDAKYSMQDVVLEWRKRYQSDQQEGIREVLNSFFQVCAGRALCILTNEDLNEIEMSNLVKRVLKELESSNEEYPVSSRKKKWKRTTQRFTTFWRLLVAEAQKNDDLFAENFIQRFVDWLTTLSSAEIRAIRHTASIAAYTISMQLAEDAFKSAEQLSTLQRQLKAARGNKTTSASKKMTLLMKNKEAYTKYYKQTVDLIFLIFNGIVIHRYRDVVSDIRIASLKTLCSWTRSLPQEFLKDNYLKYVGWLLNDKDAKVRLNAVRLLTELYECDDFANNLQLFTSRFLQRYLDLCKDVDDEVVLAAIRLLIAVDKRGFISGDVELDTVETLIFTDANPNIRKAAAEFVCLQYDAFGVASTSKGGKLKKEQLVTQAVALVELAEEYVENHNVPVEAVGSIVDAFWGLDDCQVLKEWKVLTSLILADKQAPELTSEQQSILIRIYVKCVQKLLYTPSSGKKRSQSETNGITATLAKELPQLLILHQSDSEKLILLVQLLLCIPVSIDMDASTVSGLLQKLRAAYSSHRDEQLLNGIAMAFRHFAHCENEAIKKETDLVVHELFDEIIEKLYAALQEDEKYMAEIESAGSSRNSKKRGRHSKLLDMEHSLVVSMTRFCCLFKYMNAHIHVTSDSSPLDSSPETASVELGDRVDQVVRDLCKLLNRRSVQIVALEESMRDISCIKQVLMTLYLNLLWLSRPVFDTLSSMNEHQISATSNSEYLIQRIQHARTILEEALISVLQMHLEKNSLPTIVSPSGNDVADSIDTLDPIEIAMDGDVGAYVHESQAIAFQIYCDVRCLLVEKFQDLPKPYATLEWVLPKVLILLSQMCFENLMEADEIDKEDEAAVRDEGGVGSSKVDVLISLGKASICNPGSKRQAAAILRYLTGSDDKSLEAVKAFCKYFRTKTPVRFLEIQMTALRQLFTTLLIMQDELNLQESGKEEDKDDLQANITAVDQELKDLAKKLSQALGVGKIAPSLRASFFRFLCEGIRHALEDHRNFGFLECLRPYLVHLDRPSRKQLENYFTQLLERVQDIPEDESAFDSNWRILSDFRSLLDESANKNKKASIRQLRSPLLKRKSRPRTNAFTEAIEEEPVNEEVDITTNDPSAKEPLTPEVEVDSTGMNDTRDHKRRCVESQSSPDDSMPSSQQDEDGVVCGSKSPVEENSDTESLALMQPTQVAGDSFQACTADSAATPPTTEVIKTDGIKGMSSVTEESMDQSNSKDLGTRNCKRRASPTGAVEIIAQADSEDEIDSRRVRRRR